MSLSLRRQGPKRLPAAGLLALGAYLLVGLVIPLVIGKRGGQQGLTFRNAFGEMNSFVLDSLRGLDETIQYGRGQERREEISSRSRRLSRLQERLSTLEGVQTSVTSLTILLASLAMLLLMLSAYLSGQVTFAQTLTAVIAMMGSFGPVAALSNLANTLNQTLASGERVLSILEEEAQVKEIQGGEEPQDFTGIAAEHVDFAYDSEQILNDYTIRVPRGRVVGIHGPSGSGKSTLLKLLMRFWEADAGQITVSGLDIRKINTSALREMESYVEQDTCLFHDSIANNIAIGRPGAGREKIMAAAAKASVHDFIMSLPEGYDTKVGELGDTLSGGERQRIGLARAFLHDAPLLLLDEPTSNLDALNEGIILKSLRETLQDGDHTVVLVSHRASTMNIADTVVEMSSARQS